VPELREAKMYQWDKSSKLVKQDAEVPHEGDKGGVTSDKPNLEIWKYKLLKIEESNSGDKLYPCGS